MREIWIQFSLDSGTDVMLVGDRDRRLLMDGCRASTIACGVGSTCVTSRAITSVIIFGG
jgi:hypothetical protein